MSTPYERGAGSGPAYEPDPGGYAEQPTRGIPQDPAHQPGYAAPGYEPAGPPQGYPAPGPQQPAPYPPRDPRERYRDESSFGDEAARFNKQYLRTPETKEFFKTSEFALTVLVGLVMLISAAVQDNFDAPQMWGLMVLLVAAYVISRGLAKAGTSRDR